MGHCIPLDDVSFQPWLGGRTEREGYRGRSCVLLRTSRCTSTACPARHSPRPTQHVTVDQSHLAFAPHVVVVQQGTTVEFKNDDNVGHNVYWPAIHHDKKLAHNMGTWPQGLSKPFTFTEVGDVPLLCNVHPEMSGYIFVVPTPYFAVTDKDGNFVIKDVPPGQYTLKTGSENGKPATQPVTVASGTVSVNLTVTK